MRESETETEEERDKVFGFGDTIIKQRGERERGTKEKKAEIFPGRSAAGIM